MADWSRVVNTTISNFIKGEEINILRNRALTALIKKRNRITFNWGGDDMVWRIRYKRAPLQGYLDAETLTFPRRDRWKTARLEWRGYAATDSMTKGEKLKNKSTQAIINIYDNIAKSLMEDCEENFCDELYVDGGSAINSRRIHGIESFMGTSGPAATGYIATPSDTFANLQTGLGIYGGSWTGNWPTGVGSPEYDFWSPLLVDFTDSLWSAGTDSWETNSVECLRYALIKTRRNKSKKGKLDMVLLNDELYRLWLNNLDDKERIAVQSSTASSTLIKMGFTDTQNFDGCDITWEYGTPANTGYGFNTSEMEIRSMQKTLFVAEGPEYDIASKSWQFSIDFYGNCVWNPRAFFKLYPYTT